MPCKTVADFINYTAARRQRIIFWLFAAYVLQAGAGVAAGIAAALVITGVIG